MIPKFVVILIGCIFGSIAGIIPSNLIMFYGFTTETFTMSIPFIVVGLVGVVACFYFAQKMETGNPAARQACVDEEINLSEQLQTRSRMTQGASMIRT